MGKTVVVSGHLQPVHRGHVEYFELAKAHAGGEDGRLIVILNSDRQAVMKKGYCFMPFADRAAIVRAMRVVDEVVEAIDDDRSVCATLAMLATRAHGPRPDVFANSGDRSSGEVPEAAACRAHGIAMIDLPAPKVQSSSWILEAAIQATGRA